MQYRLFYCLAWICAAAHAEANSLPNVFTCGNSNVTESRVIATDGKISLRPVWSWSAGASKGMPRALAEKFSTIDECKPAGVPDELLVTSSHDAVAIVSHKDGSTLFSAEVKNAHSAALLSDGLLAVASSDARDGKGDRVVFFDRRRSNLPLAEYPIAAAHGLVWIPAQHTLWVLGLNQLMKLNVTLQASGVPTIGVLETYPLPEATGHDLHMNSSCDALYLSTTHQVWQFELRTKLFSVFAPLANVADVKSFSIDPTTQYLTYTVADPGGYWTTTLRFMPPASQTRLAASIYKTRWTTDLPQSCASPIR
jgi:hypothetical protein